ncbi:hypothetical protein Ac42p045 [Acinetobacter phage Ac42]|uniref:hypothetical protein n=1 Tax=Acinetobacter phage Ac42 TaxID=762660 RepID=UPI0001EBCC8F|nr:hypothetical protein Ac42p045 [Acinetobacter phage Ac42]ADI96283.1 hypothetical protein Ac42p045 [Acinetobacter phage Ac42]
MSHYKRLGSDDEYPIGEEQPFLYFVNQSVQYQGEKYTVQQCLRTCRNGPIEYLNDCMAYYVLQRVEQGIIYQAIVTNEDDVEYCDSLQNQTVKHFSNSYLRMVGKTK